MDPNMVRLEGVRRMEREAEAERKRLEQTSPQDKPQEQPTGQVSLQSCLFFFSGRILQTCIAPPRLIEWSCLEIDLTWVKVTVQLQFSGDLVRLACFIYFFF